MTVSVKLVGRNYRVIEEATGRIATNHKGTPIDGGGHGSMARATSQARAINKSLKRGSGKK